MTTRDDLIFIERSLQHVWSDKLSMVFPNRSLLKKILILVFDKSKLYIFLTMNSLEFGDIQAQKLSHGYFLYEIKHSIPLTDADMGGWWGCIKKREFLRYLPDKIVKESQLVLPRISGPVSSLFLNFHKKLKEKTRPFDPYITKESYMATIIHEFGHAYFNSIYMSWHGIRNENITLLKDALSLYSEKTAHIQSKKIAFTPFISPIASEVYAFCAEYFASMLFYQNHKKNIDQELATILPKAIQEENAKDLNFQSSVLDSNNHLAAAIFGKLIITRYGNAWPRFFSPTANQFRKTRPFTRVQEAV